MRMKKATAFGLAALMAATMIPAVPAMAKGDDSEGSVYYLNFKPEQADQWSDLAKKYTDETGVPVTVVTAASGTYESTLKSEMAKDEVPTLFQVNGPVGLASWKDYCYDLKDSDVYKNVESDDFVLKDDSGAVDGIAYVIETYGIIYNKALLKKYCEMDGAVIKSADEINNFETLKKVADDIQAKKDDLGVALILPVTGDSKHILQTFRSIMSTKKTESHPQMRSREHTSTTSRTCLTFISQILPVSQAFFPARRSMMQMLNLVLERLCSIRMEPGLMITSKITK